MSVRLETLKTWLWAGATLLTALGFPMQVYAASPTPVLLPYVLIAVIITLTRWRPPRDDPFGRVFWKSGNIDMMVILYVSLVLFDCAWQAVLGVISPSATLSALVNYVLPVVWYWFFRRFGSDRDVRAVLVASLVSGLIVGIFFVYDSYLKLALQQVSPYAREAFEYSVLRSGLDPRDVSDSRVAAGFRSYGLLRTHSVSGGWTTLGAFAALALTPPNRRVLRRGVVLLFATFLLVGLNFTSIVAFSAIVLLFELGGAELLCGRVSLRAARNMFWLAVLMAVIFNGVLLATGEVMAQFVVNNLVGQGNFALGTVSWDTSMVSITIANMQGYAQHLLEYPMSAIWGDGFASYGLKKGGDIGWVESLARFGIPFSLLIVVGLTRVVMAGVRRARARTRIEAPSPPRLDRRTLLKFAVSVVLLGMITDLHYTVWEAKSVLPIVFFSLALFSRYLSDPPRRSYQRAPR